MNGLAAYRTPRYQSGGSISGDIGSLGGLNAPIDIGLGALNPTPVGIAAALSPVGLGARTANALLSAVNVLSGMIQQQQEPAPIEEASVNTIADVAVSPVANPTAPVETAISAPMGLPGLAAMTAQEQAQQDQANVDAAPDSIADAIASIASDPATAAAVAEAVGVSTDAQAAADGMGAPSGSDGGPSGPSGAGDESSHGADGNNSGGDSTSDGGGGTDTGAADSGWYRGGQVRNYAQGGLTAYGDYMNRANFPMEMRYQSGGMTPVAQSVANQGRMGDSMMVHMNPMEVAGLQALARSQGTSMTINPQTGMPEAFNLSAALPFLAGMALNAFAPGVGSAIGSALGTSGAVGTGLAVGGATALGTGSLKKGLMAGLGAYGGAGLGEGLVSTATPTTPPGMDGALGTGVTQTAAAPTLPGADVTTSNLTNVQSPFGLQPTPAPAGSFDLAGTSQPGLNVTQGQAAAGMPVSAPGPFANMSGKDMFKYGSAAYSGTAGLAQPEYEPPKSTAMLRPYTYKFNPVTGAYDRTPGDTSERLYGESTFTPGPVTQAAAGGLMSYMRETNFDDPDDMYAAGGLTAFKRGGKMERPKGRPLASAAPYDFMSRDETMLQSVEKNFAKGGRFLVGDGDGMSDDIPAMIADKQPARLADGEFVIPADVVSHLGNGSSKAGAERLHDMMRKIRKERTGREKQAPAVKAEKFMPA